MIKPGPYKHYKGNFYEVFTTAKHTETEEEIVLYKAKGKEQFWVRPLAMFQENVEKDGKIVPRFKFMGEV